MAQKMKDLAKQRRMGNEQPKNSIIEKNSPSKLEKN